MKTIYCVMGRTSAGKDTFVQKACANGAFRQLISYTSREPRSANENTHIFSTRELFEQHKAAGWVIAETEINGNVYWAIESQLEDKIIYVIDPRGLEYLREHYGDKYNLVAIYVWADREVRKQRFINRGAGETAEKFDQRDASETDQFDAVEQNKNYNFLVENNSDDWVTPFLRFWNYICGKIKE